METDFQEIDLTEEMKTENDIEVCEADYYYAVQNKMSTLMMQDEVHEALMEVETKKKNPVYLAKINSVRESKEDDYLEPKYLCPHGKSKSYCRCLNKDEYRSDPITIQMPSWLNKTA